MSRKRRPRRETQQLTPILPDVSGLRSKVEAMGREPGAEAPALRDKLVRAAQTAAPDVQVDARFRWRNPWGQLETTAELMPGGELAVAMRCGDRQMTAVIKPEDGESESIDTVVMIALRLQQSNNRQETPRSDELGSEGCGDNSCMFGRPAGMGTNGGCSCFLNVKPKEERRKIQRLAMRLRRMAAELDSRNPQLTDLIDRLVRYQSGENQIIDRVWKPKVERLEAELELVHGRLAACSTAATAPESHELQRDNPHWSSTYQEVKELRVQAALELVAARALRARIADSSLSNERLAELAQLYAGSHVDAALDCDHDHLSIIRELVTELQRVRS